MTKEGAGNAGCWPHPWPACRKKSRRQSPQVQPRLPGIPRAIVYGLYALSSGTGLIAPVARVLIREHRDLGASTGTPGPHDFDVRTASFVRTQWMLPIPCGHRLPASRVVTIARNAPP